MCYEMKCWDYLRHNLSYCSSIVHPSSRYISSSTQLLRPLFLVKNATYSKGCKDKSLPPSAIMGREYFSFVFHSTHTSSRAASKPTCSPRQHAFHFHKLAHSYKFIQIVDTSQSFVHQTQPPHPRNLSSHEKTFKLFVQDLYDCQVEVLEFALLYLN